jgi:hypothetical protein
MNGLLAKPRRTRISLFGKQFDDLQLGSPQSPLTLPAESSTPASDPNAKHANLMADYNKRQEICEAHDPAE